MKYARRGVYIDLNIVYNSRQKFINHVSEMIKHHAPIHAPCLIEM